MIFLTYQDTDSVCINTLIQLKASFKYCFYRHCLLKTLTRYRPQLESYYILVDKLADSTKGYANRSPSSFMRRRYSSVCIGVRLGRYALWFAACCRVATLCFGRLILNVMDGLGKMDRTSTKEQMHFHDKTRVGMFLFQ